MLPFLFVLYVVAFIDRINLGFAALAMNPELAISSQQFGLAAGIFFWGYFLFEIPSNLILHRIGARVWLARIMVTWGTVAALTGFVRSAHELYVARFALGLAEAGFFPGLLVYLNGWFGRREKAQVLALILMGIPIASVLGAPVSGFILDHVHWSGLSSWRWLFILEGAPAIICAPLCYSLLPDLPVRDTRIEARAVGQTLLNPKVWHLACIGFGHGFGAYTFGFWLPQIMKSVLAGQSNTAVGFAVMIPNLAGLIAMIAVARYSDRTQERRWLMVAPATVAGIAMMSLGAPHSPLTTIVLCSAVAMGAYSVLPVLFSVPGELLSGVSAAVGIAVVTSIANLGGFVGPYTVGVIRQQTGNPYYGLICAGTFFLFAAALASVFARQLRSRARASDPASQPARLG